MDLIQNDYIKSALIEKSKTEGFSSIGITQPNLDKEVFENLEIFLQAGYHGQMSWLERRLDWRKNPISMWPEVKSVIVVAENYTPIENPLDGLKDKSLGNVSVYARGKDYHKILKKKLKRLATWLVEFVEEPLGVKVFVDTAPIMEKPFAQLAGIGWQGKHTNLVAKDLGNWFFLGVIFTDFELPVDLPQTDKCGSCNSCVEACPTNAFPAPYILDAKRCISYLTIEHKGPIDLEFRSRLGNRIYGCDDCLAVCPWNKFAKSSEEIQYSTANINQMNLGELSRLSDSEFRILYAGSPIKRIGRDRFVRNVLYAIGNSQFTNFRHDVKNLVDDPDLGVSDAAKWALKRLDSNHGK